MSSRTSQSAVNQKKNPPNNSITRDRLPDYLKHGSAVEISSTEPELRGSWFAGTVVTTSSAVEGSVKCQVEYTTLIDDEVSRKRLREDVDVGLLRPQLPFMSQREKQRDIEVGEQVDAYYNDCWWEGEVTEVLEDGKVSVFFRGAMEQIRFSREDIRFHREWIDGAWKPPLEEEEEVESEEEEEDESAEEKEILSQVDPETTRAIAKRTFSNGTLVEVSSEEDGFKGSWFAAKVIRPIGRDKYLVEYRDLREDDGIEPLREETDFLHIRPVPPSDNDLDFAIGDKIDAFINDGWWVGVVTECKQDGRVGVYFRRTREKMRFGRRGLRLHKDWVNGTWQVPMKEREMKREKIFPCNRNVRPRKATEKQEFSIGTPVEVSSIEKGFEDSWFLAKLIEHRGTEKCLVQYDHMKAEDGKESLREEVDVSQIRPQPVERIMVSPFEKLDKVEALYNDGWWVGEIRKVLAKSCYLVYFKKSEEMLKFHHTQLRPHQEWVDGKWITYS